MLKKYLIKVRHGITTGTRAKTATVKAKSKDHAYSILMADGNVGPFIDWEEDFDVEYDTSPEYYIKRTV